MQNTKEASSNYLPCHFTSKDQTLPMKDFKIEDEKIIIDIPEINLKKLN